MKQEIELSFEDLTETVWDYLKKKGLATNAKRVRFGKPRWAQNYTIIIEDK